MPDFDWQQAVGRALVNRFVDSSVGWQQWRDLVEALEQLGLNASPSEYLAVLDVFLQGTAALGRRPPECRVFVSHRGDPKDTRFAERIAWRAVQKGYGYWLDIHDGTLQLVNRGGAIIPPPARDVLIAAIIEMGLLNSSHVIAVMTANSAGSKWIPYEFGRAKERLLVSRCSAVWLHRGTKVTDCGEYVHLGQVTATEGEIDSWLGATPPGTCALTGPRAWPHGAPPAALPPP